MRRIHALLAATVLGTTSGIAVLPASSAHAAAQQPDRVLDTRVGTGAPRQRLAPGTTIALPLGAAVAGGARSAALDLTTIDALAPGYLTAWPCGQAVPVTSIVNFTPGRAAANFVAVGIGAGGVCLASSAPVDVVADLTGTFTDDKDFVGAAPTRVLDTRSPSSRFTAGETRQVSLGAGAGYGADAGAAALNVTVVNPAADGYVTVYPCGARPNASTVTFRAHDTVPAFTTVPMVAGAVCVFALAATDVVLDTFGWSSAVDGLRIGAPSRLLDTRSGFGWPAGSASPRAAVELRVAGRGDVPNNAAAVLLTVTAVNGTADGYVTAWPCDQARPTASVLGVRPGSVGSNLTYVPLAVTAGTVCLYAYTADGTTIDLVADAVGWAPGGPDRAPPPPDPVGTAHFGTLPVGASLPSDASCATQVRRGGGEVRPSNDAPNHARGHTPPANAAYPYWSRVTGDFTGTTDEVIQWAACKWGFDEDILRAQVAKESWWHMSTLGDFGANAPDVCAPGHPIGADGRPGLCPESVGLLQVRYQYFRGGFPDAEKSSAFNLDISLSVWRTCFEGDEDWLNTVERGQQYAAGDQWGCVGRWFSGRWHTAPSEQYIAAVQDYLAAKIWTTPDFAGSP